MNKKQRKYRSTHGKSADYRFVPLNELSPYASDNLINVVIETPKGSPNKLGYSAELGTFKLDAVMPQGSAFPFDFGFIPGTIAGDGDPLDVLVLMEHPLSPGTVVGARLIGVIEGDQTDRSNKTTRNDRLIAVSPESTLYEKVKHLSQLPDEVVDQIQEFFVNYNAQRGKTFAPKGKKGRKTAKDCFERARQQFQRKQRA